MSYRGLSPHWWIRYQARYAAQALTRRIGWKAALVARLCIQNPESEKAILSPAYSMMLVCPRPAWHVIVFGGVIPSCRLSPPFVPFVVISFAIFILEFNFTPLYHRHHPHVTLIHNISTPFSLW